MTEPLDTGGVCGCCGRTVDRIHLMEWDGPLSWLCDECCEGAIEEENWVDAEREAESD